jgi:integrase
MYRGKVYTISPRQLREFFHDPTIPLDSHSWPSANHWWQQRERELDQARYQTPRQGLQEVIKQYLDLKRSQVHLGLSPTRLVTIERSLGHLDGVEVSPAGLQSLYTLFMGRIRDGKWSLLTAREYFRTIQQFLGWAGESDLLEIPRNLRSRSFSFRVIRPAPSIWTPDQFQWALFHLDTRLRACFLLAANCAMYSLEVANLTPQEVDWTGGRITRRRGKTGHHESVPTVQYPLWATTLDHIQRTRGEALVVPSANGLPLTCSQMDENGLHRKDYIYLAWWRLRGRIGMGGRSLKEIRKTGASLLGSHPIYRQVAPLYLGHAPSTMADRHYVQAPQTLLDEAIGWLGRQLGQVP